jgi:hypothetical protein
MDWSFTDQWQARDQGWCIHYPRQEHRFIGTSNLNVFATHRDAFLWVSMRAATGDELCRRAIQHTYGGSGSPVVPF